MIVRSELPVSQNSKVQENNYFKFGDQSDPQGGGRTKESHILRMFMSQTNVEVLIFGMVVSQMAKQRLALTEKFEVYLAVSQLLDPKAKRATLIEVREAISRAYFKKAIGNIRYQQKDDVSG